MRNLNMLKTNIGGNLSQLIKGVNPIGNYKMLGALLLAGLLASLAGSANAQSRGGWAGRIQIGASRNTQAADNAAQREVGNVSTQDRGQANDGTVSTTATKPTLVGSWFLTVNLPDNAPPFDSFKALWCLTGDGLLVASAQGDITPTPFPSTSSAYGAWTQNSKRQFAASFIAILYDVQTGENMGSINLNQSITLSESNLEWSGPFQAKVLDPDGNLIVTLNGTATARRITVQGAQ